MISGWVDGEASEVCRGEGDGGEIGVSRWRLSLRLDNGAVASLS